MAYAELSARSGEDVEGRCGPEERAAIRRKKFLPLPEISTKTKMFEPNDEEENYGERIAESFGDIFFQYVDDGAEKGGLAGGMIAGVPGVFVGMIAGSFFGGIAKELGK